ncbi:Cation efflux system protein CusB [Achromobacter deleyi]|uniref:Cation efflux system protein CusB n=1 Tax=Achromobacter deleyi TaxID=1353891 RepID=A0A6S7BC85_9BURK|nr:efflux RND transporter periplasmic adaptor subunit [Achromobacter deleyi]CAB3707550.1 Cation efflux system protein CusB [Achromobacter deleyi]CAB3865565.1 Cation efflux system protein CusB [Achromobacter deleyi]CAB3878642.1 Cation efflux system protein CusB [Achromobacter deleyi]
MRIPLFTRTLLALALGGALLAIGYLAGNRHPATPAVSQDAADKQGAPTDRKVLYWHDPMVPAQHFDKPGKSPFMDMALQPVYADDAPSAGIAVSGALQQSLGIRYARVRRADVAQAFDEIGATQFDESATDVLQSRTPGYIEQLYANAPLQRIEQGAPMASLFVPDWLGPQEEYLAVKRSGDGPLLAAARARLRALSVPAALVSALDRTGQVQTHLTLTAPRSGVMTELNVRNGAMVTPGQTIARFASLSTLWLIIDIPEAQASRVQAGMTVDASPAADPATHYTGRIQEILPGIRPDSRSLQARLQIANPDLRLTPGLLMRVRLESPARVSRLLVPSEALITTGKRTVVIARGDDGALRPVDVTTGIEQDGDTEILSGLADGQQVVASGQFLIDSEASLKAVLPTLAGAATPADRAGQGDAP